MPDLLAYLRTALRRSPDGVGAVRESDGTCSWEAMRAVYEGQAARGVPEAMRGLELIEQGRWPTSGHLRRDGEAGRG